MKHNEVLRFAPAIALGLLLPGVWSLGAQAAPPARKPNILVIVADDLGYAGLGCQGGTDIATPNIDSIAKNGVRFTNAYVSCPVCSPTRAGLMTGRYQQRFGHEFNPGSEAAAPANFGLPLSEVTLADRLKSAGYATGIVGKWHLGYTEKYHPMRRGFDEFFGFLGGSHGYLKGNVGRPEPILRGTTPVDETEYLTEAFTREAVAFIDRHRTEPFFLYLTYNAVHAPMQVTRKYLDRFAQIDDEKRRTHVAMLAALDDGVGTVLKTLRAGALESDTLIFFVSDNGGPTRVTTSRNDPLRGLKGQVLEGGIRVPFLVQWKGHLPEGKVDDQPVISLDIHPTAVAAAGGELPAASRLDGVNLLPRLTGQTDKPPHEVLFWRYGPQSAIRKGNWKLVKMNSEPPQLYDLAADVGENHDLAKQKPDLAEQLAAALERWDAELAKPLWGGRQR